ncbi:dipeptidase [Amycolatopsis jejuensis]|uniref:dipeptidase n=1 Tax=Amycolatopsis jejuensis TaxID=330084 RepID=UPI0005267D4A|nr:membrane dipeptidase [Amycolatopsis jejuensis]
MPTYPLELTEEQENRAVRVHREAVVIDCSSVVKAEPGHIDRARTGGITATNHTVTHPNADLPQALREINEYRRWIEANPADVLLATKPEHIHEAKKTNREAVIFGPQNTEFLGTDVATVDTVYDLGIRVMQLTYQRQNWVAGGCGEQRDGGLTGFGREVVSRMDELGIVVDLSHCGHTTGFDAIAASRNPVIFSHAHPYRLAPHIRAKQDDLLRALAEGGGVIGITALSTFLYDPDNLDERPGLGSFVAHLQYLIDLIGIDHVGIGLDFDETINRETWMESAKAWPELYKWNFDDRRARELTNSAEAGNITRALVAAGFTDDQIRKILGENFLRVFEQVWGTAR